MLSFARSRILAVLVATAVLSVGAVSSKQAPHADALGTSSEVDEPADYQAQTTCTTAPRPGTVALAKYLLKAFPVTRSIGMMRSCTAGARSEHKDGRAFDWGADVANASTRKAAYAFIKAALATDAGGNRHALARRMGIMYLIYDVTIWASYRDFQPRPYLNAGCPKLATCSRTLRHLNHVHISLGFAGAAAQTSWYRERNVASEPVFYSGTRELDPRSTAVTGFRVPASGVPASSPFLLRAGVTYRIVAVGAVRFGPGAEEVGDASCVRGDDGYLETDRGPVMGSDLVGDGSDHRASPYSLPLPTTHGLLIQGALRWESACNFDHLYETWFTPAETTRLTAQYVDFLPSDNSNSLSVYVVRDDIFLSSLKAGHAPVRADQRRSTDRISAG